MVLLQQMVNGLAIGGIYALIAIGWTTVFGVVNMINWTHGEVYMMGAFVGYFLARDLHFPFVFCLTGAMLFSGGLAVLIDILFYRPLRRAPRLALFITALGASTFLRNLGTVIWGPHSRAYPEVLKTKLIVLGQAGGQGVGINSLHVWILVCTAAIMLALQLFLSRTMTGKAMLAAAQDMEMTELMGAQVNTLISVTFFLSGLLGGAAGVLVGVMYAIDPVMGAMAGLKGWAVAVLGGIGSITGAMVSGVMLGLVESVAAGFISSGYKDAIAFALMIAMFLLRPHGLMGQRFEEKV